MQYLLVRKAHQLAYVEQVLYGRMVHADLIVRKYLWQCQAIIEISIVIVSLAKISYGIPNKKFVNALKISIITWTLLINSNLVSVQRDSKETQMGNVLLIATLLNSQISKGRDQTKWSVSVWKKAIYISQLPTFKVGRKNMLVDIIVKMLIQPIQTLNMMDDVNVVNLWNGWYCQGTLIHNRIRQNVFLIVDKS